TKSHLVADLHTEFFRNASREHNRRKLTLPCILPFIHRPVHPGNAFRCEAVIDAENRDAAEIRSSCRVAIGLERSGEHQNWRDFAGQASCDARAYRARQEGNAVDAAELMFDAGAQAASQ